MDERDLVELVAPAGTDECSHDRYRYLVERDGRVLAPSEAVGPLITVGGFMRRTANPAAAPPGMVELVAPNPWGCSWGGASYLPDERGMVVVPANAAPELRHHGYRLPAEVEAEAEAKPAAPDPRDEEIADLKRRLAEAQARSDKLAK